MYAALVTAVLSTAAVGPPPDGYEPGGAAWTKGGPIGSFESRFTEMNREFSTLLGGELGITALRHLMVTVGAQGNVGPRIDVASRDGSQRPLSYAATGVWTGLYGLRWRVVHGGARLFLGGGRVCLLRGPGRPCRSERAGTFVSTLEAGIYVRLFARARLGITGGYRFVVPGDWDGPGQWALSGGEGTVRLEIGVF